MSAAALLQPLYARGRSTPATTGLTTGLIALATSAAYVPSGRTLHYQRGGGVEGAAERREAEQRQRKRLLRQFRKVVALLIAAYAICNVDLEMCLQLRALRSRVGLPWAQLLELHGWWHVLTALGASEHLGLEGCSVKLQVGRSSWLWLNEKRF
ncbi:hypothetical protein SLS62_003073 [Diatrype stigma]|uniref:Alkaline ceramidase n=1 Tax=Diatrype stigma TaxID=117547 RepID=A0AAN9UT48_9PEZI